MGVDSKVNGLENIDLLEEGDSNTNNKVTPRTSHIEEDSARSGSELSHDCGDNRRRKVTRSVSSTDSKPRRVMLVGLAIIFLSLLGATVGIGAYTLKWKKGDGDADTPAAEKTWLIKVANLESSKWTGRISIEYRVTESSEYLYYVNTQGLSSEELDEKVDLDDISLILTTAESPTLAEPGKAPVVIRSVLKEQFPYLLPENFLPGDYRGIMLLEGSGVTNGAMTAARFDLIVDARQNIGSPTQSPTLSPTNLPSEALSLTPSDAPSLFPTMIVGNSTDSSGNTTVINVDGEISTGPPALRQPSLNFTSAPTSAPTVAKKK